MKKLPNYIGLTDCPKKFRKLITDIRRLQSSGSSTFFYFYDGSCHKQSGTIGLFKQKLAPYDLFLDSHESHYVRIDDVAGHTSESILLKHEKEFFPATAEAIHIIRKHWEKDTIIVDPSERVIQKAAV